MRTRTLNSSSSRSAATLAVITLVVLMILSPMAIALSAAESDATQSSVPGQIQFSGALPVAGANAPAQGSVQGPQGVSFSLYAEQTGGTALWIESQNVSVSDSGSYSVLLGAATVGGIPQELL